MRKIELLSEELAKELLRHLQDKKFTVEIRDNARRTIQISDKLDGSQWSNLKTAVERWASGKNLEAIETLRVQARRPEAAQATSNPRKQEDEVKKKIESLGPQKAEERYNYLSSKPLSELTDAEYEERLALAQRPTGKDKAK